MFEKLLSVLPYTPGLGHQLAFYSRRMREEAAIRRTGLVFLALTFMVQFFAVLSPPQPTSAASNNDLINGGISSRADAVSACRNNLHHYGDVMNYYGIQCSDIASSDVVTIHSTGENRQLYSMGRLPYGKAGETPVTIKGASYYWRFLWSWDTGGASTYQALKLHSNTNKTYWILFNCGNLVTIGVPAATEVGVFIPTPQPAPTPTPKPTPPPTPTPPPAPPKPPTTPMCVYNSALPANSPECKPCDKSLSSSDTLACVNVHKTASNQTQNIPDANNSTARPGDVITYTLFAKNGGKATVKNYVFQENLSDVMDYATVTNAHGGSLGADNIIRWPKKDIPAGQQISVQITVQVKNPLPTTPVSTSDPGHFDMIMTNVYGNTININLPAPTVKTVETAAASLPNTGPGAGLVIAGLITMIAAYFYARARLLAKESALAIQESSGV